MFIPRLSSEIVAETLRNSIVLNHLSAAAIPGSTANIILQSIGLTNSIVYDYVARMVNEIYPANADGPALDRIAQHHGLTRRNSESDNSLRSRIQNIARTVAKSNTTALRSELLGVPGVRDVYIKEHVFGIGSFGIYVETLNADSTSRVSILQQCQDIVRNMASAGTKYLVYTPNYRTVDINLVVTQKGDVGTINSDAISSAIARYINTLRMGDNIVYNKIIAAAVDGAGSGAYDIDVSELRIDNKLRLRTNVIAEFDDLFIPGTIKINTGA